MNSSILFVYKTVMLYEIDVTTIHLFSGYMAPEYASEGLFSIKSDVYSFGVLVLEIVSGKRTSSFHRYGEFIDLLGHAWQMWKDETWLQLVDPSLLGNESHTPEMMRCINIALLCVQENATDRPTMSGCCDAK
ncbi:hypothetical protein U9M48_001884 [Paspalum notatum var. saurae]|uniref:Serine-threonine/tyrosine-protein kinase catalytic domain-containing protein n=1 Tax=Paspalum notatum var. saurae TaxID=547442 RepID=A0AAQ3PIW9_PASNO